MLLMYPRPLLIRPTPLPPHTYTHTSYWDVPDSASLLCLWLHWMSRFRRSCLFVTALGCTRFCQSSLFVTALRCTRFCQSSLFVTALPCTRFCQSSLCVTAMGCTRFCQLSLFVTASGVQILSVCNVCDCVECPDSVSLPCL